MIVNDLKMLIGDPNHASATEAYFEIGVKGAKNRGTMYFWATCENNQWAIDRLELQLKNDDKRLAVVKSKSNANAEAAAA
jgi:cytochrome c oxidase assembly factor 1